MVAEYNKLAKKYNSQDKNNRVVLLKDLQRIVYIYKLMTSEQKKNAEPFPNLPPPPPPAPPKVSDADIAPPPPPPTAYPKNAKFMINNEKASLNDVKNLDLEAIQTIDILESEKNRKNVKTPTVYITTKDFKQKKYRAIAAKINGKICDGCMLEMTKEELKNSVISLQEKGKEIEKFRIKCPKRYTVTCSKNKINDEAKSFIENTKKGEMIQIFGIQVKHDKKMKGPILITLLD